MWPLFASSKLSEQLLCFHFHQILKLLIKVNLVSEEQPCCHRPRESVGKCVIVVKQPEALMVALVQRIRMWRIGVCLGPWKQRKKNDLGGA